MLCHLGEHHPYTVVLFVAVWLSVISRIVKIAEGGGREGGIGNGKGEVGV